MSVRVSMGVLNGIAVVPTWDEFEKLLRKVESLESQLGKSHLSKNKMISERLKDVYERIGALESVTPAMMEHIPAALNDAYERIGALEYRINNNLPGIIGKSAKLAWEEFNTLLSAVKRDMDLIIGVNNRKLVVVEKESIIKLEKLIEEVKSKNKKLETEIKELRAMTKKVKIAKGPIPQKK